MSDGTFTGFGDPWIGFEAITWKRLGLYLNPIVMVNTRGFFLPCVELLETCIRERFMDTRHSSMWMIVDKPEDVVHAIKSAPQWHASALNFAEI